MRLDARRICSILFVLGFAAGAAGANGIPWDIEGLSKPPQMYAADGFDVPPGLRALFYDGLPYKGRPTRVFAWYGAPEVASGAKVPAMVLVHGGGGTAFSQWVQLWNQRGYAAIAMDTCGCVPRGKYGDWQRHEHGGPPGWGGFDQLDDPVQDQWTYHAVADAVLAHSLIRSFAEVDSGRIGLTGISWGGYLTCIIAGVDHRFQCAVPVYGCGYLGDNSAWLGRFAEMGPEKSAQWLKRWDPSGYLGRAKMPMLWVTGTNDFAYPMDSLQCSYRLPQGPRQLCIRIRMPHGHMGPGENPEEIRAFADSLFNGGTPMPRITGQGRDGNILWLTYDSEKPIAKAELAFTKDSGKWQDRKWEAMPAGIEPAARRVSAAIPENTTVCYINLFDNEDLAVSSEHVELAKPKP